MVGVCGFFISWPWHIWQLKPFALWRSARKLSAALAGSEAAKSAQREANKTDLAVPVIFDMFFSPGKNSDETAAAASGLRMGIDFGSNCAEKVRRRLHPSVCIPRDVVNGNASVENSAERQKRRGARRTTTRTAPHTRGA